MRCPVHTGEGDARQVEVAELDRDVVGGAVGGREGPPQFRGGVPVRGGCEFRDNRRQCGGRFVELGGADLAAEVVRRGDQLRDAAGAEVGVGAEVVEVERFADGADEFREPVLLEFRHVGLSCQGGDVDTKCPGDGRHEVWARVLVSRFDLMEQAV